MGARGKLDHDVHISITLEISLKKARLKVREYRVKERRKRYLRGLCLSQWETSVIVCYGIAYD